MRIDSPRTAEGSLERVGHARASGVELKTDTSAVSPRWHVSALRPHAGAARPRIRCDRVVRDRPEPSGTCSSASRRPTSTCQTPLPAVVSAIRPARLASHRGLLWHGSESRTKARASSQPARYRRYRPWMRCQRQGRRTRDRLARATDETASPETNHSPASDPLGRRSQALTSRVRAGSAASSVDWWRPTMERFAVVPAITRRTAT